MEQAAFDSLLEITRALNEGKVHSKQARTYLERCIYNLLHLEANTEKEVEDILRKYLPVFDRLISLLPNGDAQAPYYRSIVAIIRGDYQEYLVETERFYAAKSIETPDWLDWPTATYYFDSVLWNLPILGKWDDQIAGKLLRAHQKYSAKYFPQSGYDLFCKFQVSNGSDQYRLKLLRDVLEKDPKWTLAWLNIGDIYFDQKKWAQALDVYQTAMADRCTHKAALFFSAAWASEQLKDRDTAIDYYRRCIDLDPAYPYVQNNLGWNLYRQKRYIEAEPYLRYAVEHDQAHHAPASEYRKLIEAVKRHGEDFRLLGLTATPFRTAEKEQGLLSKLFPDDILHKTDLRTLIERGILSEPIFRSIQTNIKMADWFHAENADELMERIINEKGFDFDSPGAIGREAARLIAAHSERNRLIVDTYVKNQNTYGKTLVLMKYCLGRKSGYWAIRSRMSRTS